MHILLSSSLCCGKELQDLKFPSKELQNYKKAEEETEYPLSFSTAALSAAVLSAAALSVQSHRHIIGYGSNGVVISGYRSNDMVISALSPWERILMHALWTMQIEMSFFLSFIHAAHVFDKMLTWIIININIMGSDAKVNQVLKSGAVHLKTILQQQQEDVTTSLKNLRWLIKTRADALLYLRTTLGEECCDITQELMVHPPDMLNSLYTIRRFHTLQNELANARMYWTAPDCGESYASTAVVKEPTIGAFPSTNVAIGTSLADRTAVAVMDY
ncbi:topless-related protein [Trifolium repens]|nr:topless-related protein [Trifolium repens]